MPIYHTLGRIPRKRHIIFRRPDGKLYAEQLMGNEGFTGPSSLLYHVHPPTTVKAARRLRDVTYEADTDRTLARHFRTARSTRGGSLTLDRTPILFNDDVVMLYSSRTSRTSTSTAMPQGDEVVYVAEGEGKLETQFGTLAIGSGTIS
jgi:homogentisate 1,2-dioxygenase